jgi:hypothetical protein
MPKCYFEQSEIDVCIFPSEGGFLAAHMLAFEGDIAPFAG